MYDPSSHDIVRSSQWGVTGYSASNDNHVLPEVAHWLARRGDVCCVLQVQVSVMLSHAVMDAMQCIPVAVSGFLLRVLHSLCYAHVQYRDAKS